jgi:hypothetical protein
LEYEEFLTIIGNLIEKKATQDGFIKIKDEPKLVLKEILVVQQIEDLNDKTIALFSDQTYSNISWNQYSDELRSIIHHQLQRSGFVYDYQPPEVKSREAVFEFVSKIVEVNPEMLFKHLKNELIHYYFRVNIYNKI